MNHPKILPNNITRSLPQISTSIFVEIVENTESPDTAHLDKSPCRGSMEADFSPKNFINPKYSERRKKQCES